MYVRHKKSLKLSEILKVIPYFKTSMTVSLMTIRIM